MGARGSTFALKTEDALKADKETGFNPLQLQQIGLDKEELKNMQKIFNSRARSDSLNLTNFQALGPELGLRRPSQNCLDPMFKALDKDGMGAIGFKDFAIAMATLNRGSLEDKIKFAFTVYDQDKSRYVDAGEITGIFMRVLSCTWNGQDYGGHENVKEVANAIIKACDKDQDGVLSEAEFRAAVYKYPALLEFMGASREVEDFHRMRRRERRLSERKSTEEVRSEMRSPRTPRRKSADLARFARATGMALESSSQQREVTASTSYEASVTQATENSVTQSEYDRQTTISNIALLVQEGGARNYEPLNTPKRPSSFAFEPATPSDVGSPNRPSTNNNNDPPATPELTRRPSFSQTPEPTRRPSLSQPPILVTPIGARSIITV